MSSVPRISASSRRTPARNAISAGAFASKVFHSLLRQGYDQKTALGMSQVYGSAYNYLRAHWSSITTAYGYADKAKTLWDGGRGYQTFVQANTLINNARAMNASSRIIDGMSGVRIGASVPILSATILVMQATANHYHVQLNECALSVAQVSLDLAGVAGGGATVEFGVGGVLAVMSIISGVNDSRQLILACTARAS